MVTLDKTFSVPCTVEIPDQRVADLIVTGMEGNAWFDIKKVHRPEGFEKAYYNEVPLLAGGSVVITDYSVEEEGEKPVNYVLNRETLEKGLKLLAAYQQPRHWKNFIEENEDQETGDVFIQLCCFGDVLYS
jgi:hypothetical protein